MTGIGFPARTALARKLRKRVQGFVDSQRYPPRGNRAVALTNEIANALEILDCGFGPPEAH